MGLFDNLDKYDNKNITCYLYIGKFNNNNGSCLTDEKYFNEILNKIKIYISRYYKIDQYKCYKYYDKELRIYNNTRIAFTINPLYCSMEKSLCIALNEEYNINHEEFPIINNYTDVYDIYDKIYTLKNIDDVEIHLSKQYKENTKLNIFMIYIKFPIKYAENVKKLKELIFGC